MRFHLFKDRIRYSSLENGRNRSPNSAIFPIFPSNAIFVSVIAFTSMFAAGFLGGRFSAIDHSFNPIPLAMTSQVFNYNGTFGSMPSNRSDAAWTSLFPEQGGFFKHPSLAPHRSAFSVFHQLHCLDGIRQGYWAVYQNVLKGRKMAEEDFPFMSSPAHIRHCIDLLRQSLMCQPDTTIEVKDKEIGGVTGFGTKHHCRDWDQLVEWTTQWQAYGQDPREQKNSSRMHHIHQE